MIVEFDRATTISDEVRDKSARLLRELKVDYVKMIAAAEPPPRLLFWVLGDSDEIHFVVMRVWRNGKATATCPCKAGEYGTLCSHVYASYRYIADHRLP